MSKSVEPRTLELDPILVLPSVPFLSIATGASGFRIDEEVLDERGKAIPCHIRIVALANTRPHQRMLKRIIVLYNPA